MTDTSMVDDLVRSHRFRLVRFADSLGATDPEGVVNEVFLRTFRRWPHLHFASDEAARAYLFRAVRNLTTDEARKRAVRPNEVTATVPETSRSESFESTLLDTLAVKELLDRLTPLQRTVIQHRFLDGLSMEDTARLTGKPVGTVKALQHRGLRRLKSLAIGVLIVLLVALGAAYVAERALTVDNQPISTGPGPVEEEGAPVQPLQVEPLPDEGQSIAATLPAAYEVTDSGQSMGNAQSRAVASGDMDGDGDDDLIFANNSAEPNTLWLNDGSGSFSDSGQLLGEESTWDVSLGDLDGDGDLDVVFGNWGEPNLILLNDGAGMLVDTGQRLGSGTTQGVASADFDGDGDLDLFFANDTNGSTVWLNNGAAEFTDTGQRLGTKSLDATAGDIDGDGDVDVITANWGEPNTVWVNDGAGGFSDSGQELGSGNSTGVALGDLDGDGDADLVLTDDSGPNTVWFNDGAGVFADSGQLLGASPSWMVELRDVDGDGDLDAAVANWGPPSLLWLNDGAGGFVSGAELGTNNSTDLIVGDVNADGIADVTTSNNAQPNTVNFGSRVVQDE